MKTITTILLLMAFHIASFGQTEKDIVSKITKVTVYTKGAQIESEAKVELQQGKSLLSFKNLSPYIHKESVRVDGDGNFTILNVQLHDDYLNELEKNKQVNELNASIQQYLDKIEDEETWIKITNEKLDFIKTNKSITGSEKSIVPEVYKSMNSMYGDNMEKYTMDVLKRQRMIKDYKKELDKLNNQLNTLNSKSELPSGIITVMVDSKQIQASTFKLTYMVDNASWYPSYDIRYVGANKPLSVSYKANISQNTGIDWKNVELKLSTAKTNLSAQIPTLSANYLQFYYPEISSNASELLMGKASGVVFSQNSGAVGSSSVIRIRGGSSLNAKNDPLYVVNGIAGGDISSINPNDIENMEILKDVSATAIYGSKATNGVIIITTKKNKDKSKAPTTLTARNETSIEYTIDGKQSVNSDSKLNTLVFKESEINASYEYQAIPKLSKNVYLIAKISDWNKANLADGETNLYFENSFIGNSNINTRQFTDTLDISFGIDNNITVDREKIKDFSETQFIGQNKKVTYAWKLNVRNNKPYPVKIKLYDQLPLSSIKDIQVEAIELSNGNLNPETGHLKWTVELNANEYKQFILKYFIKYPKNELVNVE